ncbi:MAG: response regulator [Lachnospiraceae bacterium]|nr:response regulator [Lachnospiraceae bacterium]
MGYNIVILLCQYSVVVKGIEKKLQDIGMEVEAVSEDHEAMIEEKAEDTNLFILYLPGDRDALSYRLLIENICKKVMEIGGKLMIVGEQRHETEVIINLPILANFSWYYRPVEINTFETAIRMVIEGGKREHGMKKILIVDDDPAYAKMIKGWLKDDFKVDVVTAGMQAISFLLRGSDTVDMVLLDYEMPVVDGPQVLQMLRQELATKDIPVTFLTGVGTKEAVARVMSLKPDGYILKNTTKEDLLKYLYKKL